MADQQYSKVIVNLNVGGSHFATSRQTLTCISDSFFTSLLSGRIPTVKDNTGAIFIDRDPQLFRIILNYLRTKQVDISTTSVKALKHEAEFYGLSPLVQRLALCEKLDDSTCGDVLFHAYLPPPLLATMSTNDENRFDIMDENSSSSTDARVPPICFSCNRSAQPAVEIILSAQCPGWSLNDKRGSTMKSDLTTLSRHLSYIQPEIDLKRVRIIRAHHNSIAVGYAKFACCFRMKDSLGWQLVYTSPHLDSIINHIALNTKFGAQGSEKLLAVALATNEIHLWNISDSNTLQGVKIGVFSLCSNVDNLFFIGSQLVALSKVGKVGFWHSMTHNWQVQDVVPISCHDTAGSFLLLGSTDGAIYYIDMQKFPLRMKDNDLLITELYRDPNADDITAISVYLTPKTNLCGNWIEIAYGTSCGSVRVIVQHPETVGHGPQLFQTYTVHTSPITRVALTTNHLISVCSGCNHVRTWGVTRFRGMISTQPGTTSLTSFKILTLDGVHDMSDSHNNGPGPFGDQDGEQVFIQSIVPRTNQIFVRLASNGDRLCTVRSVDGSAITSFLAHECEGSTRIGARPRRFLFTGTSNGSVQMWDLTTALDQYYCRMTASSTLFCNQLAAEKNTAGGSSSANSSACASFPNRFISVPQGPTAEELLQQIDECEICCCASLDTTPTNTVYASRMNLQCLDI